MASAIGLLVPAAAHAQGNLTYTDSKTVTITPSKPGQVPTAALQHFEHAWVFDPTAGGLIGEAQVDPLNQNPGYTNSSGYEGFKSTVLRSGQIIVDRKTVYNSTSKPGKDGVLPQNAVRVPVVVASQAVNGNFDNTKTPFSASAGLAGGLKLSAKANSSFNITAPTAANGQTLTAVYSVDGQRTALPVPRPPGAGTAEDYAFSESGLSYSGTAIKGGRFRVTADPTFLIGRQQVGLPAKGFTFVQDPVTFDAVDANGKSLVSGTALELHAGVVDNGQINWSFSQGDMMNHVHIASFTGGGEELLSFSLDGSLVGSSSGGSYMLDVLDQQVVGAAESGAFASLPLPGVGSSFSSLDLTIPEFKFDLALPDGADSYTVSTSDAGLTAIAPSPEPSSLVLLAALGGGAGLYAALRRGRIRRSHRREPASCDGWPLCFT
jgi:hypothetical protein